MSEELNQLKDSVGRWYDRSKTALEAEASFLEKVAASGDDITIAEGVSTERYSELIADTIAELMG
jgi:hypothetical protein